MSLTLYPDWRLIVRRAWSVRFIALAAVLAVVAHASRNTFPAAHIWLDVALVLALCAAAFASAGEHEDWKAILVKAWSIRFVLLAGVLTGLDAALPIIQPYVSINPIYIGIATGLAAGGAFGSRILAQKQLAETKDGP